jgi:MATE family multidrug resistance protein
MSERYPGQTTIEAGIPPTATVRVLGPAELSSYSTILRLALPLILSMSGLMVMMLLNRAFLKWYSQEAIAAIGAAGMTCFLLMSLFIGAASFTSTFVAQYIGAGQPHRAGAAVWQGLIFSLASGGLVASLAFLAEPIFRWMNHPPEVCALEVEYFRITCYGAPLAILAAAMTGFYSGRSDTKTVMFVQLFGVVVNVFFDFTLILGKLGFPRLGIQGAAISNIISQGAIVLPLLVLFLLPRARREYGTWSGRGLERRLFLRLIRFGLPNGARFAAELLAWTVFLIFVGRLGEMESAATNIVWVLNGFAFFPVIGLSEAIRVLVGQAQGQGRPDLAARCTWRGLLLGEVWMVTLAALYVAIPGPLLLLFSDAPNTGGAPFEQTAEVCTVLLRFVAVYCLLDGVNIVVMGALQGVGDTAWTLVVSLLLHGAFLVSLIVLDQQRSTLSNPLYAEWTAATIFVMAVALVWFARFRFGHWQHLRVIEPGPEDLPAQPAPPNP